MTIASAFNDIAVAQGGTASKSGAITAAIDALNDALAGSDQPQAKTIEQAVKLLGEHIGGGGGDTQYPVINYDYDTAVIDWTWKQVKDALDAGKTPLILKANDNLAEVVTSAVQEEGFYNVYAWTTQYTAESADGFPTDD